MIAHFLPVQPTQVLPCIHPSALVDRLALVSGAAQPIIRQKGDMIQMFQPGNPSLSDEDRSRIFAGATEKVTLGLLSGSLPAYVQSGATGAYFTVPPRYWGAKRRDLDRFEDFPYAAGYDETMVGQLVLISLREAGVWLAPPAPPKTSLDPEPESEVAPAPTDRTGGPGRPTPMHIITLMFRKRVEEGTAWPKLKQEAEALKVLFEQEERYSELARVTSKTIENQLRDEFNRMKKKG